MTLAATFILRKISVSQLICLETRELCIADKYSKRHEKMG